MPKTITPRPPFKFANGKTVHLDLQFKDAYKDEYTNDTLSPEQIKHAMLDEISYLCKEVVEGITLQEALDDPAHVLVPGRWVNSNKGESDHPDCRGRYVAQEVNHGGEADAAFCAATPPLESKRILFSQWAKE